MNPNATLHSDATVVRRQTLRGRVAGVFRAEQARDLTSVAVDMLALELGGVPGDRHFGFTRKAGSREPWYPRGTEIRSGRQVSIVSPEELAEAAARMGLTELTPEWIGANISIEGVARLSFLPPGTRMFFDGGATLVVEAINAPCRDAGRCIARHTGNAEAELGFAKIAAGLRGVVASVERPGTVRPDSDVQIRVPEQRLYP